MTKPPLADKREDDNSLEALASRFAAVTAPRAQTTFWRSFTAAQRAAFLNARQPLTAVPNKDRKK